MASPWRKSSRKRQCPTVTLPPQSGAIQHNLLSFSTGKNVTTSEWCYSTQSLIVVKKITTSEWCYSTQSVIVVKMLPPQSGAILLNL